MVSLPAGSFRSRGDPVVDTSHPAGGGKEGKEGGGYNEMFSHILHSSQEARTQGVMHDFLIRFETYCWRFHGPLPETWTSSG